MPEIQRVTPKTFDQFLQLIVALADFEKLPPPDEAAQGRLRHDAFKNNPHFEAYLAFNSGVPAGYCIVFETYSSFLAKPTLYLEDLFVLPEFRGQKIAFEIMKFLAAEALKRGCGRMEWQVLDWNENAIEFYEKLGAKRQREWFSYRMTEEELRRLTRFKS
ncbi:MAG TPA: GNAT family N-acetyltransferase [Patescibacteria group bacterium]|nr:GNAT family N-acetyltransferase [Patescibacteria group bacterium]